jgi:hypothetical protein
MHRKIDLSKHHNSVPSTKLYMPDPTGDAMFHINEYSDVDNATSIQLNPEFMLMNAEEENEPEAEFSLWYAGQAVTHCRKSEY